MEELQVGEFIRTKSGELYKIDYVGESIATAGEEVIIPLNYIENHSFKPIDLVKEGDYVNGSKVVDVTEDMQTGELHLEMTYNYTNEGKGDYTIYNKDIKSIVTSEKFASVEFNVEE